MTNSTGDVPKPVRVGTNNSVKIVPADTQELDAFGRFRVSNTTGIFDSQFQYDLSPFAWESYVINNSGNASVVHLPNESSINLIVGANDTVIRQTRLYHRYQPGRSQQIMMTLVACPSTHSIQRIGYFDDKNGIFLELNDGEVYIVKRTFSSGVSFDTKIARGSWNADSLDGTGESEVNLDFTKAVILSIDLEWLGVGQVRVGFGIGGIITSAHKFSHINELDSVYITTANLPIRYEIGGKGSLVGVAALKQICSQVSSEGGTERERGILFSAGNAATSVLVNSRRPILSVRPRLAFNSITNRAMILAEGMSLYSSARTVYMEVVFGGTLTESSFRDVNTVYSAAEYDVAATAITGGVVIYSDYVPATVQSRGRNLIEFATLLPISLNIVGQHPTMPLTDSITLVVTSLDTVTECAGTIDWREIK